MNISDEEIWKLHLLFDANVLRIIKSIEDGKDRTLSEVAKDAGIRKDIVESFLPSLEKYGIVTPKYGVAEGEDVVACKYAMNKEKLIRYLDEAKKTIQELYEELVY